MKETPMLFKGEMVRAILTHKKTQSRRIVKPQPGKGVRFEEMEKTDLVTGWQIPGHSYRWSDDDATGRIWTPPHGVPGDRIWVKETFAVCNYYDGRPGNGQKIPEVAVECRVMPDGVTVLPGQSHRSLGNERGRWRPSIFMPRWASRITLEIIAVRVERLQDISEADAIAEGITWQDGQRPPIDTSGMSSLTVAAARYKELWESINGPGSWAANPYVFVYEFKKL